MCPPWPGQAEPLRNQACDDADDKPGDENDVKAHGVGVVVWPWLSMSMRFCDAADCKRGTRGRPLSVGRIVPRTLCGQAP